MRPWALQRYRIGIGTDRQFVKADDPGKPWRYLAYEMRQSALRRFYGYADVSRPAELCPFARAAAALSDDQAFRHAATLCELDAGGMSYSDFAACFEMRVLRSGPRGSPGRAFGCGDGAWTDLAQRMAAGAPVFVAFGPRRAPGARARGRRIPIAAEMAADEMASAFDVIDDLGLAKEVGARMASGGTPSAFAMVKGMRAAVSRAATSRWSLSGIAGEAVCHRGFMPVSLAERHRYGATVSSFAAEAPRLPAHAPMEAAAKVHNRFAAFIGHGMPPALASRRLSAAFDYSVVVGHRSVALSETLGRAAIHGYGCADLAVSALVAALRVVSVDADAFVDPASYRAALTAIPVPRSGRYAPELALAAIAFGLAPDGSGPEDFARAVSTVLAQGIEPIDLAAARVFDDIEALRSRVSECAPPLVPQPDDTVVRLSG